MIVGAASDDVGPTLDQGSAHIYRWTGSGWTLEATLIAADGAAGDSFGTFVALDGDTAIVGAYTDDIGTTIDQGSAYVFIRSGTTWAQQAKLIASDGAFDDRFGCSVAISGNTAIIGAYTDDIGPSSDQGSAYVFVRTATTWTQQARLTAADGTANDDFGVGVAISGDTAIVGAMLHEVGASANQGAAYVFTRSGTTWTQQARLTAADGTPNDRLGISVAISGDTALAAAYFDDVGANPDQGSVYVFTRSDTTWTQQAKLTAADGADSDWFGYSIALSGDTALIGAYLHDVGAAAGQGAAYAFTRSGTTWTQLATFTASDGAAGDNFGRAVALRGDTAVIGSSSDDVGASTDQGSAWVFSRVGSQWIGPDLTLLASDGAALDLFAFSVAFDGDTAIVGAPNDDVGANANQGSAYIFVRNPGGTVWTQQAKLTAADGRTNDQFGFSVALSGNTAVVGIPLDDWVADVDQGSACVFVRSGTTWTQQAQLDDSGGLAGDWFGASVTIDGDFVIVGAPSDDVGANTNQGSAYVFFRSGTTWYQHNPIRAGDGAANDNFGYCVALSGDTVVVGARADDVGANVDQGSAYVFKQASPNWTQQAQLHAPDGAASDYFGTSVALDGNTILVGAYFDDVGASTNQGSTYVFVRFPGGTVWTQQAQLTASDGAFEDHLGSSVAISGDTALVGASGDDIGASIDQGSARMFVRSGTTWTESIKLTATGGAAGDAFGQAVALSGNTALVGAIGDNIGANADQGSVSVFDLEFNDDSLAHNDVTGAFYNTLAAAMLPAESGQQITATEAAWRGIGSINTLGRSLALLSSGDLRTPSTSTLELGGASVLAATPGSVTEIFGQIRVSSGASADITADAYTLGSRGIMTARTGSSLTINTPVAELDGQTRLEQGASLTFAGSATAIGPTTGNVNSSLTAGGTFTNIDTFTITAGTITAPLFWNRAQANIFGSSAVIGSYTNEAGATTTIRSGTLFVFGSLTNNGTIVGTICSNCTGTPPNLDVTGDLNLGAAANLIMPFEGSLVRVGGDFNCAINSSTRYDLSLAALRFESTAGEQTLEVMSTDIGPDPRGLDRSPPGHYPIKRLHIGPSPSTVRLVDAHDNDMLGQTDCEAIYVDALFIDAGSRLINTNCKVYFNTLSGFGIIDVPENAIPIAPPCAADFNSDGFVDFFDFDDFVLCFESSNCPPGKTADFNNDGFVDFFDFDDFIVAFEEGC
jgi:hypothetical protein